MHIENTEQRWRDMQEVLAEGGARKNTQEDRELVRRSACKNHKMWFSPNCNDTLHRHST